jgi:hypothetical protein
MREGKGRECDDYSEERKENVSNWKTRTASKHLFQKIIIKKNKPQPGNARITLRGMMRLRPILQ